MSDEPDIHLNPSIDEREKIWESVEAPGNELDRFLKRLIEFGISGAQAQPLFGVEANWRVKTPIPGVQEPFQLVLDIRIQNHSTEILEQRMEWQHKRGEAILDEQMNLDLPEIPGLGLDRKVAMTLGACWAIVQEFSLSGM